MKQKENKGITLIALIITIIILLILSGISIVGLVGENGLITQAKRARFLNEIEKYEEELKTYIYYKQLSYQGNYKQEILNANSEKVVENGKEDNTRTIKNIIPSIDQEFEAKLEVISGKLVYVGVDKTEINWINGWLDIQSIKSNLSAIPNYTNIKIKINTVGQLAEANNIKNYDIYIFKLEEYEKIATLDGNALEKEYIIENLQPNTSYMIKVMTNLESGITVSNTITVITCEDKERPIISNIIIPEIINSKTINISATIKDNDGGSGINKKEIKYIVDSYSGQYEVTDEKWDEANKFDENEFTNDVVNKQLNIETSGEYYIHILANDIIGNKVTETSEKIIVDLESPQVSYDSKKIVELNTIINSDYIKQKNNITDNISTKEEIQIENLIVKNSSNNVIEPILSSYDIYKINFVAKDKAGNTSELVTQTIITKPSKSITLKNIIPDSSFESGIYDWENGTAEITTDKARTGNKSLKYSVNKNQAFMNKNFGNLGIKDKIVYFRSYVLTNSDTVTPGMYVGSVNNDSVWASDIRECSNWIYQGQYNNWRMSSLILDKTYTLYDYVRIMLAQSNPEAIGILWWDDLMGIDLKPFGSIIPTKAWLDEMVTYFSDTKTFTW